jgi:6-phosphogluconolactonase (cycloisomerase 2 family)
MDREPFVAVTRSRAGRSLRNAGCVRLGLMAILMAVGLLAGASAAQAIVTQEPEVLNENSGSPHITAGRDSAVTFSPNGGLVAATDMDDNAVSMYAVGTGGALTQASGSPFATGGLPRAVAFSPDGKLLATGNAGRSVSVFSVGAGGALTQVTGSPFSVPGDDEPSSIAFSPDGKWLAIAGYQDFDASLYSVGTGGALTHVSSWSVIGEYPTAVTFSPTGLLAVGWQIMDGSVSGVSEFSVGSGGQLTEVSGSPFAGGSDATSITFNPAGTLFATAGIYGGLHMYSVGAGGALTSIAETSTSDAPESVSFSSDGKLLAVGENSPYGLFDVYSVGAAGQLSALTADPFLDPHSLGGYLLSTDGVAFSPTSSLLATAELSNTGGAVSTWTPGPASVSLSVELADTQPPLVGQTADYRAHILVNVPASDIGPPRPTGTLSFTDNGNPIAGCQSIPFTGYEGPGGQAIAEVDCTAPTTTAGSHTIGVSWDGGGTYVPATASAQTSVAKWPLNGVSVSSSANPAAPGQSLTYTATVSGWQGPGAPTGTVAFTEDGNAIAGCGAVALSNNGNNTASGQCSETASESSAQGHQVVATYSGNGTYLSGSGSFSEVVSAPSGSVSLSSSANPAVIGQAVTYTASVDSGGGATPNGAVQFQDGGVTFGGCAPVLNNGVAHCTFTYSTVTGSPHTITAHYLGDGTHQAATSDPVSEIVQTASTTTTVSSSGNPSAVGESVTYTASVSVDAPGTGSPTGTVAFSDGGATISGCGSVAVSSGMAQCSVSYLGVGGSPHQVTAAYSGDASFAASNSIAFGQVVTPAPTSTSLSPTAGTVVSGQQVTYTAVVSSPAAGIRGSVIFYDGGSPISACASVTMNSGTATCAVTYAGPAGSPHQITATYAGDANFASSDSPTVTETVNQAGTATSLSSSASPSLSGQQVTFTATVTANAPSGGAPTGSVVFKDGGTTISGCGSVTVSGGTAQCDVTYSGPAGSPHQITAGYGGDADYAPSATTSALPQTVNKAGTSTSVTSSGNPSARGQQVTYTASVSVSAPGTGLPTGTVAFSDGGSTISGCGSVAVASGVAHCSVTYVDTTGSPHQITATYGSDANYAGSGSTTFSQAVVENGSSTSVASSANPSVSGEQVTYTVTVSGGGAGTPTGTVAFTDGGTVISGCGSAALSGGSAQCTVTYDGPAGSPHQIVAAYGGDATFAVSTSPAVSQAVQKADTSTALSTSANPSAPNQAVTYTASVSASSPGGGSPTGTVSFSDGGSTLSGCGSVTVAGGVAHCSVTYSDTTGSPHQIAAAYSGDDNYAGSSATALSQTVVSPPPNPLPTSATLSSSANPSVSGQKVTYTATVSGDGRGRPTGTLAFKDGSTTVPGCGAVTASGGVAHCSVTYPGAAGSAHRIVARYSGDATFAASTSPSLAQNVRPAATKLVAASETRSGGKTTFTAKLTRSFDRKPLRGMTVVFKAHGGTVCRAKTESSGVAKCSVSDKPPGRHTVFKAVFAGGPDYLASSVRVQVKLARSGHARRV